jgi:excisionase family DNA binding protein
MNQQFYMLSEEGIKVLAEQITENLKKVLTPVENSTEASFLTIDEAAKLINLTKPTVYGLVHQNKIPYIKKGKRLYFVKAELLDWINSGKQKTKSEAEIKADAYLFNNPLY